MNPSEHNVTYGAYPPKLAATLHITLNKAKKIFEAFWSDDNPINILNRKLKRFWKKHGCILGLDGRPIFIRKESAIINSQFQSDGSIVMKCSMVILNGWRKKYKIDAMKVGDFHDEGIHDVLPEQAALFAKIAEQSIRKAGELLNLNIPLDAEAKIGDSWAEVH